MRGIVVVGLFLVILAGAFVMAVQYDWLDFSTNKKENEIRIKANPTKLEKDVKAGMEKAKEDIKAVGSKVGEGVEKAKDAITGTKPASTVPTKPAG